jgi:hypothetical protein
VTTVSETPRSTRAALALAAFAAVAVGLGAGSAGAEPRAEAEDAARRAFENLKHGGDPQVLLPRMLAALEQAGLPRTGLLALVALSASPDPAVRAQARAELFRRGQKDSVLVPFLVAREGALEMEAPADLQIRLARKHLEQALALAPLEEGAAFVAAGAVPPASPAAGAVGASAPASATARAPAAAQGPTPARPPAGPGATATDGSGASSAQTAAAAAQAELSRARALAAAIPAEAAASGEAHEVAGLAALAAQEHGAAQREFAALVPPRAAANDVSGAAAAARRQRALLQLARLAYARGDDAAAAALYARVSRAAPEWLDALFESSWAHFRRGEDEKALGNLLTLHAPFFQARYFPESYVLKALLLYENCRYADASRTLQQFERSWRPVHDGLAGLLSQLATPQLAAELVLKGPAEAWARAPEPVRAHLQRLVFAPELVDEGKAAVALAAELDSFDGRTAAFRSSELARAVLPALRAARQSLLEETGRGVRARLSSARSELRELLAQSLRLSYEIAGREKELARDGAGALALSQRGQRSLPQVEEDEELWPFQGEYWRDELGSYQFTLGEHCRRAAPGVPAQLAAPAEPEDPVAAPAKAVPRGSAATGANPASAVQAVGDGGRVP